MCPYFTFDLRLNAGRSRGSAFFGIRLQPTGSLGEMNFLLWMLARLPTSSRHATATVAATPTSKTAAKRRQKIRAGAAVVDPHVPDQLSASRAKMACDAERVTATCSTRLVAAYNDDEALKPFATEPFPREIPASMS